MKSLKSLSIYYTTYCLRSCFKSTPRRLQCHGWAGALDRVTLQSASNLCRNEMHSIQLCVKRDARKRLAQNRDPPASMSSLTKHSGNCSLKYALCAATLSWTARSSQISACVRDPTSNTLSKSSNDHSNKIHSAESTTKCPRIDLATALPCVICTSVFGP